MYLSKGGPASAVNLDALIALLVIGCKTGIQGVGAELEGNYQSAENKHPLVRAKLSLMHGLKST